MEFQNNLQFAKKMDQQDPLNNYRDRFYIPQTDQGSDFIYLCGNSLGLQPKTVNDFLQVELEDWAKLGVEGHLHGRKPWFYYHHFVEESLAKLVGAKSEEVVAMNGLTVNLNLLMVSFYRPIASRYKILMEAQAFPSDQYTAEMQARFHGFDPADAVVELKLRDGEHTHRTEDILAHIESLGDELALVMLGGVNYYTGQLFDIPQITKKGHDVGALVGWDLAHAAGNVELSLHDWGPDFAAWCSYKYLNSGPGGVSGVFVHERHSKNADLPRFAGWWGNDEETRFLMKPGFYPQAGAAAWQMSNAPVLSLAAHRASLAIFDEVGMPSLRKKGLLQHNYLRYLLSELPDSGFQIITPEADTEKGCQVSMLTDERGKALFDALTNNGVIADWREPNVIRLAAAPLYNKFEELYRFVEILKENLQS